jgi:hypothetical protein
MATPDPALGLSATFPTADVRNALLFAMQMGKANDSNARLKFIITSSDAPTYWQDDVQLDSPPRLDRDGKPLNPNIEVRKTPDEEVEVDAAVEVAPALPNELPPIGNFRPSKLTVTLMEQEYDQVKEAREVLYNTDRYVYGSEPEIDGLFDLDFHQIVYFAVEDS